MSIVLMSIIKRNPKGTTRTLELNTDQTIGSLVIRAKAAIPESFPAQEVPTKRKPDNYLIRLHHQHQKRSNQTAAFTVHGYDALDKICEILEFEFIDEILSADGMATKRKEACLSFRSLRDALKHEKDQ